MIIKKLKRTSFKKIQVRHRSAVWWTTSSLLMMKREGINSLLPEAEIF